MSKKESKDDSQGAARLPELDILIPPNQGPFLFLEALSRGIGKITAAYCAACAEAGSVCLQAQGHRCGVRMAIRGDYTNDYEIHWTGVNEEARLTWNDPQLATEYGAYGIAFLLIRTLTKFTIIERSIKGPGFDYWLGCEDDNFQRKARLEVSGIRQGSGNEVDSRVREKLRQVTPSDREGFPAYVVVVEFTGPLSKVVIKKLSQNDISQAIS